PTPPPTPGPAPSPSSEAAVWSARAQGAAAGLAMIAIVLLAWQAYQGSHFAARPMVLQRSESAPSPTTDQARESRAASYTRPAMNQPAPAMSGGRSSGHRKVSDPAEKIDVNRAGLEELQRLPGIGPALARRIVDKREQLGGFERIEQLRQVSGIGAKTL